MAEFELRIRRYEPDSGEAPRWEHFKVDLDPTLSVLDGILQAKDREDGSIGVRCSCRAAICGSCGVRINGQAGLACNTQLGHAAEHHRATDGVITVEPMGNMPVIKDLITDMEEVHWKKIRRVVPWLLPEGEAPEREYVVPAEAMVDVTQTIACIQCGSCVSDCLSMEVDPLFIGPAALAKAYRFAGDPRDSQQKERLTDLAEDPHGLYDCTHCFKCVEVCPKDVAPMDQIMRLRRLATQEHHIADRNHGQSHEEGFVKIIEKKGTLDESLLLQESFAPGIKGKLNPAGIVPLVQSLPAAVRGFRSGKMRSLSKLIPGIHPKLPDQAQIRRIFKRAEESRRQLNLYIVGEQGEGSVEPEPDEFSDERLEAPAEEIKPPTGGTRQ